MYEPSDFDFDVSFVGFLKNGENIATYDCRWIKENWEDILWCSLELPNGQLLTIK